MAQSIAVARPLDTVLPVRTAVTWCLLLALTLPLGAQVISSGPESPVELIEADQVVENAMGAVRDAIRQRLEHASSSGLSDAETSEFREFAERRRVRYRDEIDSRVTDLLGDGSLDAAEVGRALKTPWNDLTSDLDMAIEALRKGYSIPPTLEMAESRSEYYRALARYTFRERNGAMAWLMLLASVSFSLAVAYGLHRLIKRLAKALARREYRWTADVLRSTSGPIYVSAVLVGLYFGLNSVWLPGLAVVTVPRTLMLGLSLSLTWLAWQLCGPIATGLGWLIDRSHDSNIDEHVLAVIARILRVVVIAILAAVIVQRVLQTSMSSVVAGLGVLAIVLAIALRSPMQNLVASLTLFADRPFRIGDMVVVETPMKEDGDWGWIEDIGVRSTKFRSLDGHRIAFANQTLLDEPVVNITARGFIRRQFRLSLTYGTSADRVEEALEILRDILDDHDGQPQDWPPQVLFESFGDYDLQIFIQYCYSPPDFWEAKHFDSRVNLEILRRFNEAGLEFAFPTQTQINWSGAELEEQPTDQDAPSGDDGSADASADGDRAQDAEGSDKADEASEADDGGDDSGPLEPVAD